MSCDPDLAAYGLTEVDGALGALEDAVLRQACRGPVGRARAGRAGGLLRALEIIVRHILFLMALALRLPALPARTRHDAAPGETGPGLSLPRRRYMRMVLPCLDFPGVDALSGNARQVGSVPVLPILVRIGALARVLARPEAAARRLARWLERARQAGEPALVVLPLAGLIARRLRQHRSLALLAGALPMQLSDALRPWPNTS